MVFSLGLVLGSIGWRIVDRYQRPGRFDEVNQGYCDFHNGVYFPAVAFVERFSPYGSNFVRNFPVERPIPAYAPVVLLLHAPLAILDLRTAELVWFAIQVAMLWLVAWLSLRFADWPQQAWLVAGVAAGLAGSRSGYGTLFTGYFTFELVIGTLLAVYAGHRPFLGGLGLALACIKPTSGIPLVLLMLARGQWKTVAVGVTLAGVGSLAAIGWVISDGTSISLLEQLHDSQRQHREDPNILPINTWTRVDLLAVVSKWMDWRPTEAVHLAVMLPLLAWPMAALWRYRRSAEGRDEAPEGLVAAAMLLSIMVSMYHHHYDLLVLAPVILAAIAGTSGWLRFPLARWGVALLCAFPLVNYLTSNMVLGRLESRPLMVRTLTSINGVMLAAALLIVLVLLWRTTRPARSGIVEPDRTAVD